MYLHGFYLFYDFDIFIRLPYFFSCLPLGSSISNGLALLKYMIFVHTVSCWWTLAVYFFLVAFIRDSSLEKHFLSSYLLTISLAFSNYLLSCFLMCAKNIAVSHIWNITCSPETLLYFTFAAIFFAWLKWQQFRLDESHFLTLQCHINLPLLSADMQTR